VVTGFNRHVRNPIYLAAITIFLGEALLFGQLSMLLYAIAVWVGAAAFVRWYEEPALAARFGAHYRGLPSRGARLASPVMPLDPRRSGHSRRRDRRGDLSRRRPRRLAGLGAEDVDGRSAGADPH